MRERLLAERTRALDKMGVKWSVELRDGRQQVRFIYALPNAVTRICPTSAGRC